MTTEIDLKEKETIQDHPLDPKQVIEVFTAKTVGNFRYLVTEPWNGHLHYPNDIDRSLNETVTDKIKKYRRL
jgi:hypothetical protein